MTFAQVSYSNPVRQSLFTFEDCQKGGRDKAVAAADALKKIFPAVTAKGYSLTIPMPAHPLSSSTEADVREQYCQLEELIKRYKNVHIAGLHKAKLHRNYHKEILDLSIQNLFIAMMLFIF